LAIGLGCDLNIFFQNLKTQNGLLSLVRHFEADFSLKTSTSKWPQDKSNNCTTVLFDKRLCDRPTATLKSSGATNFILALLNTLFFF